MGSTTSIVPFSIEWAGHSLDVAFLMCSATSDTLYPFGRAPHMCHLSFLRNHSSCGHMRSSSFLELGFQFYYTEIMKGEKLHD